MYCEKCGTRCIKEKRHVGFDLETGKKQFEIQHICPKRSKPNSFFGFMFGFNDDHTLHYEEYHSACKY